MSSRHAPNGPAKGPHKMEQWAGYGFWVMVVILFVQAIAARLALPHTPFSDPDVWGYLFPGLSGLGADTFVHTNGRSFPYPLFIYGILKVTGSFDAIAWIQHGFGLAGGVAMVWIWRRLAGFFPLTPISRCVYWLTGLAIFASYLLSRGTLLMEHSIRPEALFPFFTVLCPLLAIEYLIAFYRKKDYRLAFFLGAALVFNAFFVYFLKPAWGLAAGFAILPVVVSFLHLKGRWLWKSAMLGLPMVVVLVTLWYPEKQLSAKYDPRSERFLHQLLFSFNAHIIYPQLVADLESPTPPFDRALIARVAELVKLELDRDTKAYRSLGFDADNLMYRRKNPDGTIRDSFVSVLSKHYAGENEPFIAFCQHYYRQAWRTQPGRMMGKIVTQYLQYIRLRDDPFDRGNARIEMGFQAERSLKSLDPLEWPVPVYETYLSDIKKELTSDAVWRQGSGVKRINRFLRPVNIIGLFFVLGLGGFLLYQARQPAAQRRGTAALVVPFWLTAYLYSLSFGKCLTVAIIHTMEVSRYVKNQLIYILLAEGAAVVLFAIVVELLIRRYRNRRLSPAETPTGSEGQPARSA